MAGPGGSKALVITDGDHLLVWEGVGGHHADQAERIGPAVLESGHLQVVGDGDLPCPGDCPIHAGVVAPLIIDGVAIGTVGTYGTAADAGLIRATGEIARWVWTCATWSVPVLRPRSPDRTEDVRKRQGFSAERPFRCDRWGDISDERQGRGWAGWVAGGVADGVAGAGWRRRSGVGGACGGPCLSFVSRWGPVCGPNA